MLVLALKFSRDIRRRAPSYKQRRLDAKKRGRTPLENGTESHASDQLGVPGSVPTVRHLPGSATP
jgi:hypothetical protein